MIKKLGMPLIHKLSIFISILLLAEKIFWYSLLKAIGPIFLMPIEILIYVLFYINLIWSVYYLVIKRKEKDILKFLPITVGLLIFFSTHFFSIEKMALTIEFYTKLGEREKIVSMLESGELTFKNIKEIKLPDKYKNMSKTGSIYVEKSDNSLKVLFIVVTGPTDNFSGFIYCSDNNKPEKNIFGGNIYDIKMIKTNWFWVSFT